MLNLGMKDICKDGVKALGFNMEDVLEQERDAALGNGGLGRLAACYLDSGASQVTILIPAHARHPNFQKGTASMGLRPTV
jgi:glucan phosphorylase